MQNIFLTNTKYNRLLIAAVSILFYVIACITPAISFKHDTSPDYGYGILSMGWLGIIVGLPTWYANLAYISVLTYFINNQLYRCKVASLIMIAIISSIILLYYPIFPADEGGVNYLIIKNLEIGAYLWCFSLLLPAFFAFIYKSKE